MKRPRLFVSSLSPMVLLLCVGCFLAVAGFSRASDGTLKFDFGSGEASSGWGAVTADASYSAERGFGFESGHQAQDFLPSDDDPVSQDGVMSEQPFFFSVDVPEGNHRVRVTLGAPRQATETTIKAELRRLMVEAVALQAGESRTVEFIVNTRVPQIAAANGVSAGEVRLKAPRETTQEAWAWDGSLTLEFNGSRPAVQSIEIERVEVPTIFLLGDSTVCDQSREPYASWGQMFTAFFKPTVAIANHGESGETYRDSIGRRRLDKVLSVMQPGDYLIMQFGHNDQKQIDRGIGGPFTTYKDEIRQHVESVLARGGVPLIVSPMERRNFDADGKIEPTLRDYAKAARQAADELGVAFIDLNRASIPFYEALEAQGDDYSRRAFALTDNTHHNNYGAYQLGKAVAQAILDQQLELAKHVADDFSGFDPARPDPVEAFAVPPSPLVSELRPLGD